MAMASFRSGVVCAIFVLISMVVPSLATVYTVGDSTGWTMGTDYSTWTSGKTFTVGDSLVFNYGGGHTVDEVSASDYNTCTVGNAITSDNSGATTIALKTAGTHYYICGVIGHCGSGMKIAVTVKAIIIRDYYYYPIFRSTFAFLVLISMVVPSSGTVNTVGDSTGWTLGTDYSAWTSGKTFIVGYSLGGGHTVDEVSASDYNKCTVGNAITSDNSGATTVALETAGTYYFICSAALQRNRSPSMIEGIIADILEMANFLEEISFHYVRRTRNQSAHCFVKRFLNDSTFQYNPYWQNNHLFLQLP
ncbi:hypothetical protein GH714_002893 [Hevea brasiliensis]|uniref:Phytocyanin domain-containing protein n=1 Tax=Hevea brasiliensis TaxID=3981 RepID=A0A6A6LJC6_HEVBR|nr:hypothetical protein GH714_002893 [Hevea brasiliensis]